MSREAIERVPLADWLMGLVVLACGVAAIVAVWRYADRLSGLVPVADDEPDEGGGKGRWDPPLALPPGPALPVVLVDAIDEELWRMIDVERHRLSPPSAPEPARRIAAEAGPSSSAYAQQTAGSAERNKEETP